MPRKHRFESKALQLTYDRYIGDDPRKQAAFEEALANAEIARLIYDLRTGAGLTQAQLAARVKTAASVISRLEDADYSGHSLGMLRRIGAALDCRVEVQFVPLRKRSAPLARRSTREAARRTTGARKKRRKLAAA